MMGLILTASSGAITPADWWGIGLGIFASVVAIINLGWSIVQWQRSGAIVDVEAAPAFGVGGQPPFDELLAIKVRNTGRGEATLDGWGIRFDDGVHIPGHAMQLAMNEDMPIVLNGGASKSFYFALRPLADALAKRYTAAEASGPRSPKLGCRAFVSLGSGEEVMSDDLGDVNVLRQAVVVAAGHAQQ